MAQLLPDLKTYSQPRTLDELVSLMKHTEGGSQILAGGTSLAFQRPHVSTIFDITDAADAGCRVENDASIAIGTLTTIRQLECAPELQTYAGGILVQACHRLASTPLRNLITIGGNILGGYPWSDLPVALLALDAGIRIYDGGNLENSLAMDYKHQSRKILEKNQVLTHVTLPAGKRSHHGAFIKFSRTMVDFALVTVGVTFAMDDNYFSDVRIACGGLVSVAQRIPEAEQVLENAVANDQKIEEAGAVAMASIQPRSDTRASEEYRRDLLKTLISRAIRQALKGV